VWTATVHEILELLTDQGSDENVTWSDNQTYASRCNACHKELERGDDDSRLLGRQFGWPPLKRQVTKVD